MKKIRFVFYIAKFDLINVLYRKRKPHFIDDGIAFWTGLFNWFTPRYSHWEGWIQDENGLFRDYYYVAGITDEFLGTCYTSTMRGDNNGTVSRPASEVFIHPERWHYQEFEVTDDSFEEAKAWADERVRLNRGYSKRDILRFFMPLWLLKKLKLDDPVREICSEHGEGWAVMLRRKWFPETHRVEKPCPLLDEVLIRSPRRLWRDLVRKNRVPTYSLATGRMVYDGNGKKVK